MKLKQYKYDYLFKEYEKFVYGKYTSLSSSVKKENFINDNDFNDFKLSFEMQFSEDLKTIPLKGKDGKVRKYNYFKKIAGDIRNYTRIEAFNNQEDEFEKKGIDIFKVSTHPGARDLCFPYQGEYFSRNGKSGFLEIAGKLIEYSSLDESSYGEIAGLFGVNCRHVRDAIDPSKYLERKVEERINKYVENKPFLSKLIKLGMTLAALEEIINEEEKENK